MRGQKLSGAWLLPASNATIIVRRSLIEVAPRLSGTHPSSRYAAAWLSCSLTCTVQFIAGSEHPSRFNTFKTLLPMLNKSGLNSAAYMLLLICALSACSTPKPATYQLEQFDSSISPYAHSFTATAASTCYAARRALLSQGYTATSSNPDSVDGSKNFQPDKDSHVVIDFHVVCTSDFASARNSTIYVNAVQDRYTLKKSTTSASVGLSVLGAISLPIGSSDDSLVKISSETIPSGSFYDRYFGLVQHYLKIEPEKEPLPPPDTRLLEMVPTSKATGTLMKDAPAPASGAANVAPAVGPTPTSGAMAAPAIPASAPVAPAVAPAAPPASAPTPASTPTASPATPLSAPAPAAAPAVASQPAATPTSANPTPAASAEPLIAAQNSAPAHPASAPDATPDAKSNSATPVANLATTPANQAPALSAVSPNSDSSTAPSASNAAPASTASAQNPASN